MSKFKFIHAADLHIESPYKGVSQMNKSLGKALVDQGIKAYETLIQNVLDKSMDFLLIAGDSFDSESGSLSAQFRFVRGLEQLNEAKIPVFIICGNHDPLKSWSKHLQLPENVIRYEADEVQQHSVTKDGKTIAEIYGVSFGKKEEFRNFAETYKRNDNAEFSIGLLHGTVAGNKAHTPYCPFDMANLRASNIDYWGLGHIHKREVLSEKNPLVVYPGNIQGRHFNETGVKGCSLVEVEQGKVINHEFIPLSNIVYEYIDLDVTGMVNTSDFFLAISTIKNEQTDQNKSYLLRIRLKGKSDLHSVFSGTTDMEDLIKELNDSISYNQRFVFIDRIIDESLPIIDLEERAKSSDFVADILHRFKQLKDNETESKELIDAIMEEIVSSKVGREINKIDFNAEVQAEIQQLLSRAKWKCIDGLIKNETK